MLIISENFSPAAAVVVRMFCRRCRSMSLDSPSISLNRNEGLAHFTIILQRFFGLSIYRHYSTDFIVLVICPVR